MPLGAGAFLRRASQCFARMEYDIRLARVVVVLFDRVHRVGGRSAALVDSGNGPVTNSTAIVPRYGSAGGNRLERRCFLHRHFGCLVVIDHLLVLRVLTVC